MLLGCWRAAQDPFSHKKKSLAWKIEAFYHLLGYSLHPAEWGGRGQQDILVPWRQALRCHGTEMHWLFSGAGEEGVGFGHSFGSNVDTAVLF